MLGTFLDKATAIVDRYFLVAFWFPTFISLALTFLLIDWINCYNLRMTYWKELTTTSQNILWLFAWILIIVTVISYVLRAFYINIIQLYEGYWPTSIRIWYIKQMELPKKWKRLMIKENKALMNGEIDEFIKMKLYFQYPQEEIRIMPTKLGNILRAAEDYSRIVYGMDITFWWPRLTILLPENLVTELEETFVPVIAMLNFGTMLFIFSIICSLDALTRYYFTYNDNNVGTWLPFIILGVPILGLLMAILLYSGATRHAQDYGTLIRTAVDLYRFDLLEQLHQELPTNPSQEKALWISLTKWLYDFNEQDIKYVHKEEGET